MCTYHIKLDDRLVALAEQSLGGLPFAVWLQQQVETMLREQTHRGSSRVRRRHSRLSDEQLMECLKEYPPLTDKDFPNLCAEDYQANIRSRSGKLSKGLQKWL